MVGVEEIVWLFGATKSLPNPFLDGYFLPRWLKFFFFCFCIPSALGILKGFVRTSPSTELMV